MEEKLIALQLPILALAVISLVTYVYLKLITKKFGKAKLGSVKWCCQNVLRVHYLVGIPSLMILAPCLEELIFRVPLIILFDDVTPTAWLAISVVAIFFGAIHWNTPKISFDQILENYDPDNPDDSMKSHTEQIEKMNPRSILAAKIIHVVMTTGLGILSGYLGVKYQSIPLVVLVHLLWNMYMGQLLSAIARIVTFLFIGLCLLWDISSEIWFDHVTIPRRVRRWNKIRRERRRQ